MLKQHSHQAVFLTDNTSVDKRDRRGHSLLSSTITCSHTRELTRLSPETSRCPFPSSKKKPSPSPCSGKHVCTWRWTGHGPQRCEPTDLQCVAKEIKEGDNDDDNKQQGEVHSCKIYTPVVSIVDGWLLFVQPLTEATRRAPDNKRPTRTRLSRTRLTKCTHTLPTPTHIHTSTVYSCLYIIFKVSLSLSTAYLVTYCVLDPECFASHAGRNWKLCFWSGFTEIAA